MIKKFQLKNRKGQSAIEYLMTYGWMLLVVAIVGAAIFGVVQDNQNACEHQIMDIESTQQGFGVSDFTVTNNSLNIELENNQRDTVQLSTVSVGSQSDITSAGNTSVGFGETTTVSTDQVTSSDSCATLDIQLDYWKGELPAEQSGQLQERMAESS